MVHAEQPVMAHAEIGTLPVMAHAELPVMPVSGGGSGRGSGKVKVPWTHEEDLKVLEGVSRYGQSWAKIARELPEARTDDAVRNRWHRLMSHGVAAANQGDANKRPRTETEAEAVEGALPVAVAVDSASPGTHVAQHTADRVMRAVDPTLMGAGTTDTPRPPTVLRERTEDAPAYASVVRVALTGGPCAGKSSALAHLRREAKERGFDVLTAPEMATIVLNNGFSSEHLGTPALQFAFQKNILKMQLQLERSFTDLAASTGRATIVVFDRGLLDNKAFLDDEATWQRAVAELDDEMRRDDRPRGSINEQYLLQRYDCVLHLVTSADGAEEHYKFGTVTDESGSQVIRRETPDQARDQDRKLQAAWCAHPKHTVVPNLSDFKTKLATATEAVLKVAEEKHPPS